MRGRTWLLLAAGFILALAGPADAGKGGGGGPGGGGNPGPTPPGTIYFHVEGDGTWSMSAGGADKTFLFADGGGKEGVSPSYALHDGRRWFLLGRQTADLLPDGNYRRELVARSDAGAEVVLWSVAGGDVRPSKVWAKDDSFVSFKAAYPASGLVEVLAADVDWSTGTPALGNPVGILQGTLGALSVTEFEGFDWSPSGQQIVYAKRDFTAGGLALFVKDVVTSSVTSLGSGLQPQWSPDGSRIAFARTYAGTYTVAPDGSNLLQVRSLGELPMWSPDDAWLALTATITTGKGNKTKTADEVLRLPAQGGAESNLTTDVDANTETLGWR